MYIRALFLFILLLPNCIFAQTKNKVNFKFIPEAQQYGMYRHYKEIMNTYHSFSDTFVSINDRWPYVQSKDKWPNVDINLFYANPIFSGLFKDLFLFQAESYIHSGIEGFVLIPKITGIPFEINTIEDFNGIESNMNTNLTLFDKSILYFMLNNFLDDNVIVGSSELISNMTCFKDDSLFIPVSLRTFG